MATEVKLPNLGEDIDSADILEIFVSVGDVIAAGDNIVEVETDKAAATVPSDAAGKVTKVLVGEGDTVNVGQSLIEIEAAAGSSAPAAPAPEPTPAAAAPPPPAPKPEPTPPAAAPTPPPSAPAAAPTPVAPQAAPAAPIARSPGSDVPAGPGVRRFAREVGVDLSSVAGSGDSGRITREDILMVVRSASQARASAPGAGAAASTAGIAAAGAVARPGTGDVDDFGPINVQRMSKIRKTISRQMHASWSTVPRVTNFDDADITDLERLRQSSKEDYAAQGLKLTTMPFLIKAVATALKHHPAINAQIDEQNEQIIYKDYVNVGIAVDTDRGLVVPVMKNTDTQGVPAITRSLAEMAGKVRSGDFGMSDLKGGTFTISNLGAIGGQYSTPIVNVPEVAILLVGRSRKLPVVMPDDSIQPRLMMPLSLSYDHRLVDGGAAARFLNDVIGYLEAPSRLLLAL